MPKYVGAIDQSTTSARFMVFDHSGAVVAVDQREREYGRWKKAVTRTFDWQD